MTQKSRKFLFLILLGLFLLITPAMIFYSQGYRIDFNPQADGKKIVQTGGIFIKAEPKQAEIFIDGKPAKKTDFLFGRKLIENLLPKKYVVEVKKEGYQPWRKELQIKEKMVTEAKNIFLFAEKYDFSALAENIENFWLTPDGEKIIFLEKTGLTWDLKLYDFNRNLKSHLIGEKEMSQKGADLLKLEFAENPQEIYFAARTGEQEKNFVLNLDNPVSSLKERKISPLPKNILAGRENYYLDVAGNLHNNNQKLTQKPFPVKQETEYRLRIFPDYFFLQENKDLYKLNPKSGIFEKFFDGLEGIKISPDNRKLAFFSASEIWVLFLKEELEAPAKSAGEKIFLTRFSQTIKDVFWFNSHYLVLNAKDQIKIAEIDDRDRIQTWDVATFPSPKISFDETGKKIYILSENTLYQSENLLK